MKKIILTFAAVASLSTVAVAQGMTMDEHRETGPHAQHDHGGVYDLNNTESDYEYNPNTKDITSRHSLIMLGKNLDIGYHVSFFESRHQHQVILRIGLENKSDGSNYDLSVFNTSPNNNFYSVTSDGGDEKFKLFTIGKRNSDEGTTFFPGTFFDGIIGSGSRVQTPGARVVIEGIHHFSRLHIDDKAPGAQYMVFHNGGDDPNQYILIHMIYGLRSDQRNLEQIVVGQLTSTNEIPDGSILAMKDLQDEEALKLNKDYKATYFRKGFNEATAIDANEEVSISTKTEIHNRSFGILPQ